MCACVSCGVQAGKVANAQGMTWSAHAEYNEALQCFRAGVEATAKALGSDHLSYATVRGA